MSQKLKKKSSKAPSPQNRLKSFEKSLKKSCYRNFKRHSSRNHAGINKSMSIKQKIYDNLLTIRKMC